MFLPASPAYLQIEPSGTCNLHCPMCASVLRTVGEGGHGSPFMSFDTFAEVLGSLKGLARIHLQGLGEPFLNNDFFRMAEYAATMGAAVTASTNLTVLSEESAHKCVSSGISLLHVSVDGPDAPTYEAIRRGASFHRLIKNLELLVTARNELGSSTPVLHMTVVLMRRNLSLLPGLVRFASRCQFSQVFVQQLCHSFEESTLPVRYAPMKAFVRDQSLTAERPETTRRYFERARDAADELGIELRLPANGERKSRAKDDADVPPCDWPWTGTYISHDGYVMPCCMISTPDRANFGNVRDHDVLDIWRGDAYEAFRADLSSERPPEICKFCSVYSGLF